MNQNEIKSINQFSQNLSMQNMERITHVLGGDDGSKEPNAVMKAYNLYEQRQNEAIRNLFESLR